MSIIDWLNPANIVGKGIDAVSEYQTKKKEKEILALQAKHELAMAKQSGEQQVTLTDAQWESLAISQTEKSWKDEYVTIIFTAPIICVFIGALSLAMFDNASLLDGSIKGIESLKTLGIDWDKLTTAIVFAAIGLKFWRSK